MTNLRAATLTIFLTALAGLSLHAQITGSGSKNAVALFTGGTSIGDSVITNINGNVGINVTSPKWGLDVGGHINSSSGYLIGGSLMLATPNGATNIAVGNLALPAVTTGTGNTAIGDQALTSTTTGYYNTASGYQALYFNVGNNIQNETTAGNYNTANGFAALYNNTGNYNTAVGAESLQLTTGGSSNVALGFSSLSSNSGGNDNTAVGNLALSANTVGNYNIAIGLLAAGNVAGGNSNNIHIGSWGVSTDNNTIRIGNTLPNSGQNQTAFFAAGISGVNVSGAPVMVNSSGQLGVVSSSRRFKEDIQDMGDSSTGLLRLRPVTFRYKQAYEDGSRPVDYGLIAEEVAEVYPDLAVKDADGQILTVQYQKLTPMLLNEVQKQHQLVEQQAEIIRQLQRRLEALETTVRSAR